MHYLEQLGRTHELRLVLLRGEGERVDEAERAENERRYGPVIEAGFIRLGKLARVADELTGRGMFQHGWVAGDVAALASL